MLTGGNGADVFPWELADRGAAGTPATDVVTDFNNGAGGDVLDLRDLLVGESAGNLANYLHFSTSGADTTISVSSTGGFSGGYCGGAVDQVITLQGVNLVGGMRQRCAGHRRPAQPRQADQQPRALSHGRSGREDPRRA